VRLAALLPMTVVLLALAAGQASAHALKQSSVPAAGQILTRPPRQVIITFTERPDPTLSSVKVLDSSGALRSGPATVVPGHPTELEAPVHGIGNGVFTVDWRTVSAQDGHLALGSFAFGVNAAPAKASSASVAGTAARPSAAAVVSQWIYLIGLIGIVGAAFTGGLLMPPPSPRLVRGMLPIAWVLGIAGAIGNSEAQRAADGAPLADLFSQSLGHILLARIVPLAIAGAAVAVAQARPARIPLLVAGAAGAVGMLTAATTSHAGAAASWAWLRSGVLWVHLLAAGVWIGGLAALLVLLPGLGRDRRVRAVRRFSFAAALALAAMVITGTVLAFTEVGSWTALVTTGYGQLVLVKVGLLAVLACLGALNRYRNVPAAASSVSGLRAVSRAEVAVGAIALLAAAVLSGLAPPAAAAQNGPPPIKVTVVHNTGFPDVYQAALPGGYLLQVYLEPETRQFHIQYFDPNDNPVPTTACLVIQQRLPGGRPISLVTQHLGPGHYYATTGARNGRYLYVFTATASAFGPGGGDPGQIAAPITIYVH
jgi:copper transport protein